MSSDDPLSELEEKIGYSFKGEKSREYLVQALTHRSNGEKNNERLEFLGDAVLSFIVADQLYDEMDEGEAVLTRQRSLMTDRVALEYVAEKIDLKRHLILGRSLRGSTSKILSDAVEALIGAVYLDGGMAPTVSVVDKILFNSDVMQKVLGRVDWITKLKEYCDAMRIPQAKYLTFEDDTGDVPKFIAWVSIEKDSGRGAGGTKKVAMAKAAEDLMARLDQP